MASVYPGALDSLDTAKSPAASLDAANHTAHHNDLADAVNKIEAELGIDPAGASADLVTRLGVIDAAIALNTAKVTYPSADSSKLAGIEAGATADQSDAEIETAYNAQVGVMSQATAEAGTSTTVERVTAQRISQAIAALGGGGGRVSPLAATNDSYQVPGCRFAEITQIALTADRLYYMIIVPDETMTIERALLDVAITGAATVIRFGIVLLDSDIQPNATGLVGQTTVDPSTAGDKEVTGLSWSLTAGSPYAMLLVADGTVTVESARMINANLPDEISMGATSWRSVLYRYKDAVGTSAFADPVPDWVSTNIGGFAPEYLFTVAT